MKCVSWLFSALALGGRAALLQSIGLKSSNRHLSVLHAMKQVPRRRLLFGAAALFPGATLVKAEQVTDERELEFNGGVGIELEEVRFARVSVGKLPSVRVAIRRIVPGSAAESAGLRAGEILVSANGESLEGRELTDVAKAISSAPRPLKLVTRDPAAFNRALEPGGEDRAVTSVLADYGGERQILAVERLRVPDICSQGAALGDLVEVRYEGRLADGTLFDGSAITFGKSQRSVAGRAGDSTLYFVLGQQATGQFPTAWDPALAGACVSEVRRVRVPPVLGFQDKGSPKRGVPPYATLYYTLEVVSLNGVAISR